MRMLEWVMLVLLFGSLVCTLFPARLGYTSSWPKISLYTALLNVFVMLGHIIIEGNREQMLPAYVLIIAFAIHRLRKRSSTAPTGTWRAVGKGIGKAGMVVFFLIAALLPYHMPVYHLPAPTGPLDVGMTLVSFTNHSREERFADTSGNPRHVPAFIWYPADVTRENPDEHNSYYDEAPNMLLRYVSYNSHHSAKDAPLRAGTYPIILFSHGYMGTMQQNMTQMEELASHGYIVVSIGHPYEAADTPYPDGTTIGPNIAHISALMRMTGSADTLAYIEEQDPTVRLSMIRDVIENKPLVDESIAIWKEDTAFILDQLQAMNDGTISSPFTGHFDMEKIGIFGHSFGGITAAEMMSDPRIRAGINMDGLQFGSLIDQQVNKPFLFLYSERNKGINAFVYPNFQQQPYEVTIQNTAHFDYSDLGFLFPHIRGKNLFGGIDKEVMVGHINEYVRHFFDAYVKGINEDYFTQSVYMIE